MAYLESGIFCSAEEYEQGLTQRIDGTEIRPDELYTLAMRLDSGRREASKLAVRSLEVGQQAGFTIVRFAFVDDDLRPQQEAEETMNDGLLNKINGTNIVDTKTQIAYKITQAYFKDYFEDQFGEVLDEGVKLDATV